MFTILIHFVVGINFFRGGQGMFKILLEIPEGWGEGG